MKVGDRFDWLAAGDDGMRNSIPSDAICPRCGSQSRAFVEGMIVCVATGCSLIFRAHGKVIAKMDRIRSLLLAGHPVREVAEATGLAKGTVQRIRAMMAIAEPAPSEDDGIVYRPGTCRNGHDTAVCGRYAFGKCVGCVREQQRRHWQRQKRRPLSELAKLFLTNAEVKDREARIPPPLDWQLPRDPDALAKELAPLVPRYLDTADAAEVVAELTCVVLKQGYIASQETLAKLAKRYARIIAPFHSISADDPIPGTDVALRRGDVWSSETEHF